MGRVTSAACLGTNAVGDLATIPLNGLEFSEKQDPGGDDGGGDEYRNDDICLEKSLNTGKKKKVLKK